VSDALSKTKLILLQCWDKTVTKRLIVSAKIPIQLALVMLDLCRCKTLALASDRVVHIMMSETQVCQVVHGVVARIVVDVCYLAIRLHAIVPF
jgi:hypothetical protein